MQLRNLGKSGLKVSVVGLGCNNFGGRLNPAESAKVIHRALDLGVTLFDTADIYARGESERVLGPALGARRQDVVLATKFAKPMDQGEKRGASRRYIMRAVEDSLTRLGTDWIDLYQIHEPDPATPIEETLRALDDLTRQGKIRYAGYSNFAAWQAVEADWTARQAGLVRPIACQDEYNLLHRHPEGDLFPAMAACGLGLLPYFPLASGLLTGKYRKGEPLPAGVRLTGTGGFFDKVLTEVNFTRMEALRAFVEARGRTLLELAFSWLAARPIVSSVIAGATSAGQVEANVKAVDWRLSGEDLAEIDRITQG